MTPLTDKELFQLTMDVVQNKPICLNYSHKKQLLDFMERLGFIERPRKEEEQ